MSTYELQQARMHDAVVLMTRRADYMAVNRGEVLTIQARECLALADAHLAAAMEELSRGIRAMSRDNGEV